MSRTTGPRFACNVRGAVTAHRVRRDPPAGPVTVVYGFAHVGRLARCGGTGTLSVNGERSPPTSETDRATPNLCACRVWDE